jgi:hypothetical protein
VIAEIDGILETDVVLLPVLVGHAEEREEMGRGGDPQMEELNDFEVTEIFIFLYGAAKTFSNGTHFDVMLEKI